MRPLQGYVRFSGEPAVFYMALCNECEISLPFGDSEHRSQWADGHRSTAHIVTFAIDVRPDPAALADKRAELITRLREKYSRPIELHAGRCASTNCGAEISPGQRAVMWEAKFWHAGCLSDGVYLRLASIADLAPGILTGEGR